VREWLKILVPASALLVALAAAIFSYEQFRLASQTSERQQRAYVGVSGVEAVAKAGDKPYVRVIERNYGSTPASDVRYAGKVSYGPAKRAKFAGDWPKESDQSPLTIMPNSEIAVGTIAEKELTADQYADLASNRSAIYFDIVIIYTDIFETSRRTEVHYYMNAETGMDEYRVSVTGEGEIFK
jgi:hypothetical protein